MISYFGKTCHNFDLQGTYRNAFIFDFELKDIIAANWRNAYELLMALSKYSLYFSKVTTYFQPILHLYPP